MALLLGIDTATNYGAVALGHNGTLINVLENHAQKDHAAFLHHAITTVLADSSKQLKDVDGVVVTIGPGSYTGLRVALSAAKGLCYAAQKPLIAVNTLQAIALAAAAQPLPHTSKPVLYVPMIDARRMEVFMAVYTAGNELHTAPAAVVIDKSFLVDLSTDYKLVFAGDGSDKLKPVLPAGDHHFSIARHSIQQVLQIGGERLRNGLLEDVAYCEPLYLKPFFTTASVKK